MQDIALQRRFCTARRRAIAGEFQQLNPQQQQGVLATRGPVLLLAGAGSGKTTVLIHRISHLLRFGEAYESEVVPDFVTADDVRFLDSYNTHTASPEDRAHMEQLCRLNTVKPWEILAITFTNKAAGELKTRLAQSVGEETASDVWAATFHSACTRILRRDIDLLGYPQSFTIYDTDDSLRTIKACLKALNLDEKAFPPRMVLSTMSKAKDKEQTAEEFWDIHGGGNDYRMKFIAQIYQMYSQRLQEAGALDFDDIILKTVQLLQSQPKILAYYQKKFRFVLVDEYQDTNHLQYLLVTLLAGGHHNLCVVGDDDQSIYRFRGATIENILSFEEEYKHARSIRLEQNYRSTGHILEASNALIANNQGRKGKQLWTKHDMGEKIQVYQAMSEQDEATHVVNEILKSYTKGIPFSQHAVLYRMNAQSNQLELACKRNSIPYKVVGGMRFFDRAEIKDMLAYLCTIHNPEDSLRLLRIINTPARGIGAKALEAVQNFAKEEGLSLWTVISNLEEYNLPLRATPKFQAFVTMIQDLQEKAQTLSLPDFYDAVLEESEYLAFLEEKPIENATRIENIQELKSSMVQYEANTDAPTLYGFLEEIALYTDLDALADENSDSEAPSDFVTLMTMHAAKGLEFAHVFVVGLEEGVFPGFRAVDDMDELEEERRLCYVAMTRAKEVLSLSCAAERMLFGRTSSNLPSRFLKEVPEEYILSNIRKAPRVLQTQNADDMPPWEERPKTTPSQSTPVPQRPKPQVPSANYRTPAPKVTLPQIQQGNRVRHTAFGEGLVLSAKPMGGDVLLEIAFDEVGTKRLMLKAAAQHMQVL